MRSALKNSLSKLFECGYDHRGKVVGLTVLTVGFIAYGARNWTNTSQVQPSLIAEPSRLSLPGDRHVSSSASCGGLLSDGRVVGNNTWSPSGCSLHWYTAIDAQACAKTLAKEHGNTVVYFQGDSKMRDVYSAFVRSFGQNIPDVPKDLLNDHTFKSEDLKLHVYQKFRSDVDAIFFDEMKVWNTVKPKYILGTLCYWLIMKSQGTVEGRRNFQTQFSLWVAKVNKFLKSRPNMTLIWILPDHVHPNSSRALGRHMTNERIDAYAEVMRSVLEKSRSSRILTWSSARLISKSFFEKGEETFRADGIHLAEKPRKMQAQILLNLMCNPAMNFMDGTCCARGS